MVKIHYLDPLRSILMLLGVVLHSAAVYGTDQNWLVSSANGAVWADYTNWVIHLFRMPGFFIISGYLFIFSLRRYSYKELVLKRFSRIVLPLLTVAVSLNYIQYLFLNVSVQAGSDYLAYWQEGHWVSHLWFLINLLSYFIIFLLLYQFRHIFQWTKYSQTRFNLTYFLFFAPSLNIAILVLNKLGFPLYTEFFGINIYMVMAYLPYFIFGMYLAINRYCYRKFTAGNIKFLSLFILCGIVSYWHYYQSTPSAVVEIGLLYLYHLVVWAILALLFSLFRRYLHRPKRYWRYFSSAAYSVYLLHHLFVVMLASLFIYLDFIPSVGFGLLVSCATLSSLLIHHFLIRTNAIGLVMFNGQLNLRAK